jgi:hypothetical protein
VLGGDPGVDAGNEINPSIERIDCTFDAVVFQLCGQIPVAEIAESLLTSFQIFPNQ